MVTHGVEGFLMTPGENSSPLESMEKLYKDKALRSKMGKAGRKRFDANFDVEIMVERYREVIFEIAPPVILVDMDGINILLCCGVTCIN